MASSSETREFIPIDVMKFVSLPNGTMFRTGCIEQGSWKVGDLLEKGRDSLGGVLTGNFTIGFYEDEVPKGIDV